MTLINSSCSLYENTWMMANGNMYMGLNHEVCEHFHTIEENVGNVSHRQILLKKLTSVVLTVYTNNHLQNQLYLFSSVTINIWQWFADLCTVVNSHRCAKTVGSSCLSVLVTVHTLKVKQTILSGSKRCDIISFILLIRDISFILLYVLQM